MTKPPTVSADADERDDRTAEQRTDERGAERGRGDEHDELRAPACRSRPARARTARACRGRGGRGRARRTRPPWRRVPTSASGSTARRSRPRAPWRAGAGGHPGRVIAATATNIARNSAAGADERASSRCSAAATTGAHRRTPGRASAAASMPSRRAGSSMPVSRSRSANAGTQPGRHERAEVTTVVVDARRGSRRRTGRTCSRCRPRRRRSRRSA